jgi:hypothetical protein
VKSENPAYDRFAGSVMISGTHESGAGMTDLRPAPEGVDPTMPNVARMYDYYLGGKNNFAADREAAERILAMFPETRSSAIEGRAFLA